MQAQWGITLMTNFGGSRVMGWIFIIVMNLIGVGIAVIAIKIKNRNAQKFFENHSNIATIHHLNIQGEYGWDSIKVAKIDGKRPHEIDGFFVYTLPGLLELELEYLICTKKGDYKQIKVPNMKVTIKSDKEYEFVCDKVASTITLAEKPDISL